MDVGCIGPVRRGSPFESRVGHLGWVGERARTVRQKTERWLAGSDSEVQSLRVLGLVQCRDGLSHDGAFSALASRPDTTLVTMHEKLRRSFSKCPIVAASGWKPKQRGA